MIHRRERRIPASGINLFQLIYLLIRDYEKNNDEKVINLSLGNPDLLPPEMIIKAIANASKKKDIDHFTYAEDRNLNDYCEGMVHSHAGFNFSDYDHLKAVPIAGIKSTASMIPIACGYLKKRSNFTVVSNQPAYDVIGTWSENYLGCRRIAWPLRSQDSMRLNLELLETILAEKMPKNEAPDLIYVIRPGNPAPVGASREEWVQLIEFCLNRGIRLVNDGAYAALASPDQHVSLASVAKSYGDLEWLELYSVSKSFSHPGARLGVAVGSKEFVEDFVLVKGNTDSGPSAAILAAYGEVLKNAGTVSGLLADIRATYQSRIDYLVPTLQRIGLKQVCPTSAGFFTLWQVPDEVFGVQIKELATANQWSKAEAFNRLVIEKSGVVGVHFTTPASEALIRYAVCTDVLDTKFQKRFENSISKWNLKYHGT